MRERLRQGSPKMGSPKIKTHKRYVMGAIATPVLLGLAWWLLGLPSRVQANDGPPASHETATLASPPRQTLISGIGMIAIVAGGVYLLVNSRAANRHAKTANLDANLSGTDLSGTDLSGTDLSGVDLCGANLCDTDLSGADLSGADLNGAELCGVNLSGANLNGADLISANLSGADLNGAEFKYANLSGANLKYANLSGADFRYANLSGADLNCTLLRSANFSEANLSEALLFFINSRDALNLEPFQLEAQPSPFLCNVALPAYSKQREVDPNRDCDRIPQLLSARYDISLDEAQGIVNEARQHRWD